MYTRAVCVPQFLGWFSPHHSSHGLQVRAERCQVSRGGGLGAGPMLVGAGPLRIARRAACRASSAASSLTPRTAGTDNSPKRKTRQTRRGTDRADFTSRKSSGLVMRKNTVESIFGGPASSPAALSFFRASRRAVHDTARPPPEASRPGPEGCARPSATTSYPRRRASRKKKECFYLRVIWYDYILLHFFMYFGASDAL